MGTNGPLDGSTWGGAGWEDGRLGEMHTPGTTFRSLTIASWLVAGLAVVAALYFARTLFIPVTLAAVIALVLAPVVRVLCRLGFPRSAASGQLGRASCRERVCQYV